MSSFRLSETSLKRLDGVNPKLIEVVKLALDLTTVDFGIPEFGGVRTAEEQLALFNDGKSQLNGYAKKSYHQSGNAVDVFAYVDGKASWDESHLTSIAAAMLEAANRLKVDIRWGGHWVSFRDLPHFEIARR